jgi:prolyl-tRNA synthetase
MPGGKTLQCGTVHHLGTHFSKTFSITYEDKDGNQQLANQTCYGISERCIAALISMHGDDKGLILPPAVAPVQAVIVPITIGKRHDDVLAAAQKLEADLKAAGFRVKTDTRDMRPGAKYYWWELRGVPLRLELGPRDLDGGKVMAVKRTGEKSQIELAAVCEGVTRVLAEITDAIRAKAEEHTRSHLCSGDSVDTLNTALNDGKVAVVRWCRERGCGDKIEEKANSSILGTDVRSPYVPSTDGPCIICGKPGKATLVGRTY